MKQKCFPRSCWNASFPTSKWKLPHSNVGRYNSSSFGCAYSRKIISCATNFVSYCPESLCAFHLCNGSNLTKAENIFWQRKFFFFFAKFVFYLVIRVQIDGSGPCVIQCSRYWKYSYLLISFWNQVLWAILVNRQKIFWKRNKETVNQGPVLQSIVSLTSSLVDKMLTVLVSTISNSQLFLLKNVSSFCKCKSYSHFFSKNISVYAIFNYQSFNNMLANDIITFKQLDPGYHIYLERWYFTSQNCIYVIISLCGALNKKGFQMYICHFSS